AEATSHPNQEAPERAVFDPPVDRLLFTTALDHLEAIDDQKVRSAARECPLERGDAVAGSNLGLARCEVRERAIEECLCPVVVVETVDEDASRTLTLAPESEHTLDKRRLPCAAERDQRH